MTIAPIAGGGREPYRKYTASSAFFEALWDVRMSCFTENALFLTIARLESHIASSILAPIIPAYWMQSLKKSMNPVVDSLGSLPAPMKCVASLQTNGPSYTHE